MVDRVCKKSVNGKFLVTKNKHLSLTPLSKVAQINRSRPWPPWERFIRRKVAALGEKQAMSEEQGLNRARFRLAILKEMRAIFRQRQRDWKLSPIELSERMGIDEARVSRILNGDDDLTIDLIAAFFHALEARPDIRVELYEEIEDRCLKRSEALEQAASAPRSHQDER